MTTHDPAGRRRFKSGRAVVAVLLAGAWLAGFYLLDRDLRV